MGKAILVLFLVLLFTGAKPQKSFYRVSVAVPPEYYPRPETLVGVGITDADIFLINGTDTLFQKSTLDWAVFNDLEVDSEWTLLVKHPDYESQSRQITVLKEPIFDMVLLKKKEAEQ